MSAAKPLRIDYAHILAAAPSRDYSELHDFLGKELPYVWLDDCIAMLPHPQNVHRISVEGFEYLWDLSSELVREGIVPAAAAIEDRLVAAHGLSRYNAEARHDSCLRGRTLGPVSVVAISKAVAL